MRGEISTGKFAKRHPLDWYVDEIWCARQLAAALANFETERNNELAIWDPSAGFGNTIQAAWELGFQTYLSDVVQNVDWNAFDTSGWSDSAFYHRPEFFSADFLEVKMLGAASSAEKLETEVGGVGRAATEMAAAAQRSAAGLGTVTSSAGAQRIGMQQLGYQIGDVAQQFGLGVNPMTIFAQQGGQVVQALSLMSGESTGLLGVLGNPWVAGIALAAAGLAPLIAKLFETGDAADQAKTKLMQAFEALENGLPHGRTR